MILTYPRTGVTVQSDSLEIACCGCFALHSMMLHEGCHLLFTQQGKRLNAFELKQHLTVKRNKELGNKGIWMGASQLLFEGGEGGRSSQRDCR